MSDTFNHELDAMESYLNDMDDGYFGGYKEEDPLDYRLPVKKQKNTPKQEFIPIPPGFNESKPKIVITHFGKNLISEMTQAHLENSIKFVISKNTVLDDYKKELIKVMTNRVNELKTKQPTTSFTIIDNKTGEVIFEC